MEPDLAIASRAGLVSTRASLIRFGATTAVSLVLVVLALRQVDFASLGRAVAGANFLYVGAAVIMYFVDVGFRSWRWRVLLCTARPIPTVRLFPILTIGYMANSLLPARIGEISRAYLVGRRDDVSVSTVLASVALERVIDAVTVLILLLLSLPSLPASPWLESLVRMAGATLSVALLACLLLAIANPTRFGVVRRTLGHLPNPWNVRTLAVAERFLVGLSVLRDVRKLTMTVALSIAIWLIGATTYLLVASSFGVRLSIMGAIAAICVVNLATAVPLAPGALGVFEVAALTMLELLGTTHAAAATVTIVLHAVLFVPVVLVGLCFLWRLNLSLGDIWSGEGIRHHNGKPD